MENTIDVMENIPETKVVLPSQESNPMQLLPFTKEELCEQIKWQSHPANPLINPSLVPDFNYLADPTWMPPDQTPDGLFHLIAPAGINLCQFTSKDGIQWKRDRSPVMKGAVRPYLYKEGDVYHLFYTKVHMVVLFTDKLSSTIQMTSSKDLIHWGKPKTIQTPTVPLQKEAVGNPCVVKAGNKYLLYSSGGTALLTDCYFTEPHSIWVAEADSIDGPYELISGPIIDLTSEDPDMNIGAGSIKVLRTKDGYFIGFVNGIHKNERGGSTSAIKILWSVDGYEWEGFDSAHIVKPDPAKGELFAYACDVHVYDGKLYLYYNTRDGKLRGTERISLAIGNLPKKQQD